MIGFVQTTCSALFVYLAMTLIISTTNIARPSMLALAVQTNNRNIQIDRKLKPHSVYADLVRERNKGGGMRRKGMKGSKENGKGMGQKGKGIAKGKEGKGKGKKTGPSPLQFVLVEDYYISFAAPGATREPTQAEYDEMLVRINDWFEAQLRAKYANRTDVEFLGTESSNDFTLYGINNNIPPSPERFNIYMNFDFSKFSFSETSTVPTNEEVYEIMLASITPDFILQVVRSLTGSPFELTNEVFFAASQLIAPPNNTPVDIPVDVPVDVPTTVAPMTAPVAPPGGFPNEEPGLRIRVENFSLAYVAPDAIEPTEEQYSQLVDVTNDFFQDTLTEMFANDATVTFLRAESTLGFTLFDAGIPEERFNIYTNYSYTDLIYTSDSTPPDTEASFVLLRDSINTAYIIDYVRSLADTPFVAINEVFFQAS